MLKKVMIGSAAMLMSAALLCAQAKTERVTGTVSAIQGDHFTIKLADGKSTESVMVDKDTKYLDGDKSAKKGDVKVGKRIVVDGKMDPKMKMLVASEVNLGVVDEHKNHNE